jgi:hypothetical protein
MKLFLDDERQTPPGWQRSETAWETIWFLEHEDVTHLSLDHDLGDGPAYGESPGNGNDVAKWIEEQAVNEKFTLIPQFINCHSSNPKGKANICASIKSAMRFGAKIVYTENNAGDL